MFRLWVVASVFWIAASVFAFCSGNGGASARWVWSGTVAERASVAGQQWTPAGIYAKALLVRSSTTGATELAMSLAIDLLDCPGLRESLWPAASAVAE